MKMTGAQFLATDARRIWGHALLPRAGHRLVDAGGAREDHRHQADRDARRARRRVHGGRLRASVRPSRGVRLPDDRHLQPGRRSARRLHGTLAGDRPERRQLRLVAASPPVPGDRRPAGVRAGHQVQCAGRWTWTRLPDLLRQAFRAATTASPAPCTSRSEGHFGEVTELQEADLEVLVEERFSRRAAVSSRAADDDRCGRPSAC